MLKNEIPFTYMYNEIVRIIKDAVHKEEVLYIYPDTKSKCSINILSNSFFIRLVQRFPGLDKLIDQQPIRNRILEFTRKYAKSLGWDFYDSKFPAVASAAWTFLDNDNNITLINNNKHVNLDELENKLLEN